MANEIATDCALTVAAIEKLRDAFDINDPLRHTKSDLRRAAEAALRLGIAHAQELIRAAETLQLNFDEAVASKEPQ